MALARLDMQNLNPANITAQLANLIDEGDAAQQVMTGLIFVANSISEFLNDPSECGNGLVNIQGRLTCLQMSTQHSLLLPSASRLFYCSWPALVSI